VVSSLQATSQQQQQQQQTTTKPLAQAPQVQAQVQPQGLSSGTGAAPSLFSSPFAVSRTDSPIAASSIALRTMWDELTGALNSLEALQRRRVDEASENESVFQAKIDGLVRFQQLLTTERTQLIATYNARQRAAAAGGGTLPEGVEEEFWTKVGELDSLLERTQSQVDEARLKMYFPAAKGYTFRMAAPGIYLAVGDFWISMVRARFNIEVIPAKGAVWESNGASGHGTSPASVVLRCAPMSVSLLIQDLGLRGDSIPTQLKHIREIELSAEVELTLPLIFALPPRDLKGEVAPGTAQGGTSSSSQGGSAAAPRRQQSSQAQGARPHPMNLLSRFRWRVPDKDFKFEVTKLECRTKGTGVAVPTNMLRVLINSLVPPHIKKAVAEAVPLELGMLLAMHGDHFVRLGGDLRILSLPMDVLHSQLDSALEIAGAQMATSSSGPKGARGSQAAAAAAAVAKAAENFGARSIQSNTAAGGVRALLGFADAGAGSGDAQGNQPVQQAQQAGIPPQAYLASRAARALGLSPLQARTLIAAQMAVPQLQQKGAPFLRSATDVLDFVSKYNPRSSFRQTQIAAQGPGTSVTGVSLRAAAEAAEDAAWSQVLQIWQRLLDEHSQRK